MDINELKEELKYFNNEDIGIMVYLVLKQDTETVIRLADVDSENALPELKTYFINSINERIVGKEGLSIMNISESDERKNVIYEYDLDDTPHELSIISEILQEQNQQVFNFNEENIMNIKGYIILLGDAVNKLLLYKQHYGIYLIKRDNFLFHKSGERFVRFDKDLIRLDDNFQFFALNSKLFIKDLDKLERFFGFHEVIKREAVSSIDKIESVGILEDVEVLRESIENITFARKLTKLSINSPVLEDIPIPTIIEFTKQHPALAGKLKYTTDEKKIRLDTKVSQELFIKLLNDSFLRSDLTDMYYDSLAKDKVEKNISAS